MIIVAHWFAEISRWRADDYSGLSLLYFCNAVLPINYFVVLRQFMNGKALFIMFIVTLARFVTFLSLNNNRIYNKILDPDWFSARLFVT